MSTQRQRRRRRKRIPWIRLCLTLIAVLLIVFCVGLIFYGSASTSNDIAFGILAGISAVFAFGQWFFPLTSSQTKQLLLPFAYELVPESFRMGDNTAANFPYITTPIRDEFQIARQALLDASIGGRGKRGVLIIGEANAGKTRLAFEVLTQTLANWPVLRWWLDSALNNDLTEAFLRTKQLVIFIDDLQDYVPIQTKTSGGQTQLVEAWS